MAFNALDTLAELYAPPSAVVTGRAVGRGREGRRDRSVGSIGEDDEDEVKMVEGDVDVARQVFQRGYNDLKSKGLKNEVCPRHASHQSYLPTDPLSESPYSKFGKPLRRKTELKLTYQRFKECSPSFPVSGGWTRSPGKLSKVASVLIYTTTCSLLLL